MPGENMTNPGDDDYIDIEKFVEDYEASYEDIPPKITAPKYTIEMQRDSEGRLHGQLTHTNNKKIKIYECNYQHGKKCGEEIVRYPNGKTKEIAHYDNDHLNGVRKCFNEYGTLVLEENYSNGLLNGVRMSYENYSEKIETSYKNGKKDGPEYISCYRKKESRNYKNGLLHGEQVTERYSGERFVQNFDLGRREGLQFFYSEDGGILSIESFKEDKRHGQQYTFFNNGVVKSIENFTKGYLSGRQLSYYSSGKMYTEENFKNGERDGQQYFYYETGNLATECNYKEGQKEGLKKGYFSNGQLAFVENYLAGWKEDTSMYSKSQLEIPSVVFYFPVENFFNSY